eukprot:m.309967 g.309967  ORF g.309967 m.309967 type:complete len:335 (+) comp16372_c1_seq2:3050-4054(+)
MPNTRGQPLRPPHHHLVHRRRRAEPPRRRPQVHCTDVTGAPRREQRLLDDEGRARLPHLGRPHGLGAPPPLCVQDCANAQSGWGGEWQPPLLARRGGPQPQVAASPPFAASHHRLHQNGLYFSQGARDSAGAVLRLSRALPAEDGVHLRLRRRQRRCGLPEGSLGRGSAVLVQVVALHRDGRQGGVGTGDSVAGVWDHPLLHHGEHLLGVRQRGVPREPGQREAPREHGAVVCADAADAWPGGRRLGAPADQSSPRVGQASAAGVGLGRTASARARCDWSAGLWATPVHSRPPPHPPRLVGLAIERGRLPCSAWRRRGCEFRLGRRTRMAWNYT